MLKERGSRGGSTKGKLKSVRKVSVEVVGSKSEVKEVEISDVRGSRRENGKGNEVIIRKLREAE